MKKTSASDKLKNLLRSFPIGHKFSPESREFSFIIELCSLLGEKYKKISLRDSLLIVIGTEQSKFSSAPYKVILLESDSESKPGEKSRVPITNSMVKRVLGKNDQNDSENNQNREKVLQIMRLLVKPQIEEFRANWRKKVNDAKLSNDIIAFSELTKCPISSINLLRAKTTHVDHILPFSYLAKEFLSINKIDPFTAKLIMGRSPRFADEQINKLWIDFHRERASLQVVEGSANIAKSNKMDNFTRQVLNNQARRRKIK
jgi:hypothetical protein